MKEVTSICVTLRMCVSSQLTPLLRSPPSTPLLPPHPRGCFVVPPHFSPSSDLPLPRQQTLPSSFFLPHRPRNEMSLLLGGGGPSANKYLCAVYIHIQVHEHTYDASRLFFASFKLCSSCFLRILRHNSQL